MASWRGLHPAGLALGAGIAGAFDGIVLHQILQWHHQVSEGGPREWFLSDGLFHALAVSLLLWGTYLLWRECSLDQVLSNRQLQASVVVGFGVFNFVEGIIDHHLLQLHHVRHDPNYLSWDLMWLVAHALIALWGLYLKRATRVGE